MTVMHESGIGLAVVHPVTDPATLGDFGQGRPVTQDANTSKALT